MIQSTSCTCFSLSALFFSWKRYKSAVERNLGPLTRQLTFKSDVWNLRLHLKAEEAMLCEMDFADPTNASAADYEVAGRFWDAMLFRPDMAPKVLELMLSEDLLLLGAAEKLQEAIEAADWPQGMW